MIIPYSMMVFLPVRVQHGDQDIINMPANVHDSNNNDILSTIDPDISMLGQIAILLTAMNLILNLIRQIYFRYFIQISEVPSITM